MINFIELSQTGNNLVLKNVPSLHVFLSRCFADDNIYTVARYVRYIIASPYAFVKKITQSAVVGNIFLNAFWKMCGRGTDFRQIFNTQFFRMSIIKVIEIMSSSPKSWEDAAQLAVINASRTIHRIRSFYVKEQSAGIENGKIIEYRITGRLSFELEPKER